MFKTKETVTRPHWPTVMVLVLAIWSAVFCVGVLADLSTEWVK